MKVSTVLISAMFLGASAGAWAGGDKKAYNKEDKKTDARSAMTEGEQGVAFEKVTVTFDRGQSTVKPEDRKRLKEAVKSAKNRGDLERTEVAVWSDKAHPGQGELLEADRDLANDRISAVKEILNEELGTLDFVSEYNMAESTNWLGRMFNSSEAELDSAYARDEALPMDRHGLRMIKEEGAPSKAVVILKIDTEDAD
jgi:hypothetical protein